MLIDTAQVTSVKNEILNTRNHTSCHSEEELAPGPNLFHTPINCPLPRRSTWCALSFETSSRGSLHANPRGRGKGLETARWGPLVEYAPPGVYFTVKETFVTSKWAPTVDGTTNEASGSIFSNTHKERHIQTKLLMMKAWGFSTAHMWLSCYN